VNYVWEAKRTYILIKIENENHLENDGISWLTH